MFGRKQLNSDEYEKLLKRFAELESRVNTFESLIKAQEVENKTLRDKVLRKIQNGKENPFQETQVLNTFSPFGR